MVHAYVFVQFLKKLLEKNDFGVRPKIYPPPKKILDTALEQNRQIIKSVRTEQKKIHGSNFRPKIHE